MNSTRLVVALIALALAGLGAFLMLRSDGGAPAPITAEPTDAAPDEVPATPAGAADTAAGAASPARTAVRDASVSRKDLDLDPSVRAALSGFRGRLVTPDAEPLEGVKVDMFRFAPDVVMTAGARVFASDKLCEPDVDAGSATTGDDGVFEIHGVWPHAFYLLRAGAGTEAAADRVVDNIPGPGQVIDLGDIVVEPCGIVTGVVVDDEGKPVEGALVRSADIPGMLLDAAPIEQFDPEGGLIVQAEGRTVVLEAPAWVKRRFEQLPIPCTRSGADGKFRLCGVTPGNNVVAITKVGLLPAIEKSVRVRSAEEKDLGELRLREGEAVSGRVTAGEDRPLAGVEVLAASVPVMPIPFRFAHFLPKTDADGRFEMTGFASGDALVAVRRAPGDAWIVVGPQPVTRDFKIELGAQHSITVVLASDAGLEIKDPELQLCPGDLNEGAVEMAMWGATRPLDLKQRVDHLEDGQLRIRDVPRGKYALLARAPGHAVGAVEVDVQSDAQATVRLSAQRTFAVRVVDDQGQPITAATVYAQAQGRPRIPEMPLNCGTTGADGTLEVGDVMSDKVRVTAYHPAYGNSHAERDLPAPGPIDLVMARPGIIHGVLTEKGQKPTPGKWIVTAGREWSPDDRGAMPDMPTSVAPNLAGEFEIRGLRPGKYEVRAFDSVSTLTSPGKLMTMFQRSWLLNDHPEQNAVVVPGGVAEVRVDTEALTAETGPGANVSGSVLFDGYPKKNLMVVTWSDSKRSIAKVDAAGQFDLGRVPVGHARIEVYQVAEGQEDFGRRQHSLWNQSFKVEENKDVHLAIDVKLSGLSGTVLDIGGAPVARCDVMLEGTTEGGGSHQSFHESCGADGRFDFREIPAGTYEVTAENDKGRVKQNVVVAAGVPATVTLQLVRMLKVSGRVDLAALPKREQDWLWLGWKKLDDAGKPSNAVTWIGTDSADGRFDTNELVPGQWQVEIWGVGDDALWVHNGIVTIGSSDLEGLTISPVQRARER